MTLTVGNKEYDSLYEAMENVELFIPIDEIWSNADEIEFFEENFCGVYTVTVTYSETDIVNYEWVYADRFYYDYKDLILKPSKFPDDRIFGCLDYFNPHGLTEDYINIQWSYDAFDENNYGLKYYAPITFKEEFMEIHPFPVTISVNGKKNGKDSQHEDIYSSKAILEERYRIDWDRMVDDNFMGKIVRHCVTNFGEEYKEVYTIKAVIGSIIECEAYDLPLIHYEDDQVYFEGYRNRNVTLNNIIYLTEYVPYSLEEEL